MTRCSFYKEKETYIKNTENLFRGILEKYSVDESRSFLEIFADDFSNRSYSGIQSVYASDKEQFKSFCLSCATNLNAFLSAYPLKNIQENFTYKNILIGKIDGILVAKPHIINFSFKNSIDTQKSIDFYVFNNYIYNVINNTNYDSIIMSVPTNSYFMVKNNDSDYTIRRGWAKSIINNKMRRRGEHCLQCVNECKPLFLNNLDRLESIL